MSQDELKFDFYPKVQSIQVKSNLPSLFQTLNTTLHINYYLAWQPRKKQEQNHPRRLRLIQNQNQNQNLDLNLELNQSQNDNDLSIIRFVNRLLSSRL